MFKVLRPLPNPVKNQKLLVHILYYILFNYLDEMLKTMFECEYTLCGLLSQEATLVAQNASFVVDAKVEDGANLKIQSCSFTSKLQVVIYKS